jgi:hypothetical protein
VSYALQRAAVQPGCPTAVVSGPTGASCAYISLSVAVHVL